MVCDQDAAFAEGAEFFFEWLRQVDAVSVFGLGGEGRGVLLHPAVQRGLPEAAVLVVNRCAIPRRLGLLADGLYASLPKS